MSALWAIFWFLLGCGLTTISLFIMSLFISRKDQETERLRDKAVKELSEKNKNQRTPI